MSDITLDLSMAALRVEIRIADALNTLRCKQPRESMEAQLRDLEAEHHAITCEIDRIGSGGRPTGLLKAQAAVLSARLEEARTRCTSGNHT